MPRMTDWVDTIVGLTVTSGGQDQDSLMTGLAPLNLRGTTLIRTIISLGLSSQTVAGAYGTQRLDMAIGIASQEAFAATVLSDPVTPGDKPPRGWVWRHSMVVSQNGIGTNIVFPVIADIRGARKIENGEVFIIVNSTPLVGTSFPTFVNGLVRILMKLP